jgi:hypothetical protein
MTETIIQGNILFKAAGTNEEFNDGKSLFQQYAQSLDIDLGFQDFSVDVIIQHFCKTKKPTILVSSTLCMKYIPERLLQKCLYCSLFAVVQKFEVLETNYPMYKEKFVLIIQPCPEQGGKISFGQTASIKCM